MTTHSPITLVVNSIDRTIGTTSTDFKINLKESIKAKKISLVGAYIPNCCYNIRSSYNDKVNFRETGQIADDIATLTPGSYTSTTLATEIVTQLTAASSTGWTYTCAFSSTTLKYTIAESTGLNTFLLNWANGSNQAYKVLGWEITSTTASNSQTSTNTVDLNFPKIIYISISELNNCTHTTRNHGTYTYALFANAIGGGYYIQFNEASDYQYILFNNPGITISSLTFILRDDNENILNLNGAEFTLVFRIE